MTEFPTLAPLDLAIIIFYVIANATVGFVSFRKIKKHSTEEEEFLLAGRTLTLPAFVATVVSTWYGGIIGVGEYVYDNGIVMWVVFGIPYYVAALIFAGILAKRVNSDRVHLSIPDRMRAEYGSKAGYLSAIATMFMTSPAAYIMELGVLYQWFFGINYWFSIAIAIITSISYLFVGGFRSSIRTDILQFIMMFGGFAVIIPMVFSNYGGFSFLHTHLKPSHLLPFGTFSIWYVLVWYIAALSTLTDPNIHQRVFAARSVKVAKRGMLVAVVFWLIFDAMTNVAGLYARAAFPNLQSSKFAYPALAEKILPMGLKGVFYTGMLATVLSTVDSFFFMSATIIGRDILWRIWGGDEHDRVKRYTRIGLVVTAIISVVVVSMSQHIYTIWYSFASVLVPMLLFPLVLSYFPKWKPGSRSAELSMIAGGLTALAAYSVGSFRGDTITPNYIFGIEPMYVGMICSIIPIVLGRLGHKASRDTV
ncbi:MAG TPA: sodium:solute symporter family protein [Candidatus Kapabacteria bacterium]|nr:sodium:solute symporter family protein [Candidatus Kapabacteria bacterium]